MAMNVYLLVLIAIGTFVLLFLLYAVSVKSHYDRLPACGSCRHKLEKEDVVKAAGSKVKVGSREFCPNCRAKGSRTTGWFYGYIPKGSSFAE